MYVYAGGGILYWGGHMIKDSSCDDRLILCYELMIHLKQIKERTAFGYRIYKISKRKERDLG